MNDLTVFQNDQFGQLRTVQKNGQPWFVAADVCRALEISNNRDAMSRLDPDEKADVALTDTSSNGVTQTRNYTIISEPGLYSLVLGSRKPEARQFKRWVTHDVIPSIRSHGAYLTPELTEQVLSDPDTIIRLATDLKKERSARIQAEQKIAEDAPKVLFADSVSNSSSDILVGELAKLLHQNGLDIGQNRLYDLLRKDGYIMKNTTIPTQYAMERGLFRVVERTIVDPGGATRITKTTKVTGKGQLYFINRYLASPSQQKMNLP